MKFKQWFTEVFSRENSYLKQYLQQKSIDLQNNFYHFLQWHGSDEVIERLGFDREELEQKFQDDPDAIQDAIEKIENSMSQEEREDFANSIEDQADAPTWHHLDYRQVIPRNTWLIHFSDEAHGIAWKGFKYGVDDMTRLGLTTWLGNTSKKYGGYNFAFEADSNHARYAASDHKYGEHAVMFQASGVLAYHWGDKEQQVVFWGPAIAPGTMIYLQRTGDDEWCVVPEKAKRECLYTGPFKKVVAWVEQNHQQYRKSLYKIPPATWYKSQRPFSG